jgi:phosphoketolase
MLETLISSKTRVKLLLKFFLNSTTTAYLRNLETEFGESTNAIRLELNKLEETGLLKSSTEGNKKIFQANTNHPLFSDINSILLKYVGFDTIIEKIINNLGDVDQVFVTGAYAKGLDNPVIDLIFVGNIDRNYLADLAEKVEKLIKRKIKYIIYEKEEFNLNVSSQEQDKCLLLWNK